MPELESEKGVAKSLRLLAYVLLLLFNVYHVATEQIAKANKEEIQALRAEFSEIRRDLIELSLRREKARTDFDLFYEQYERSRKESEAQK